MAYGTELALILDRELLIKYLIPGTLDGLDGDDLEDFLAYEAIEHVDDSVGSKLISIHLDLVKTHLDPNATVDQSGYVTVNSSEFSGSVQLSPFSIEALSDEDGPVTYGISLISRYFPTWIDWKEPHGGSGDPIILDEPTLKMAELARVALSEVIPELLTAPLGVVLVHY